MVKYRPHLALGGPASSRAQAAVGMSIDESSSCASPMASLRLTSIIASTAPSQRTKKTQLRVLYNHLDLLFTTCGTLSRNPGTRSLLGNDGPPTFWMAFRSPTDRLTVENGYPSDSQGRDVHVALGQGARCSLRHQQGGNSIGVVRLSQSDA